MGGISLLAFGGILITRFAVPDSRYHSVNSETHFIKNSVQTVINNRQLVKLNFGIFCLHTLLMANFVALPLVMIDSGLAANQHWKIYLVTLLIAFITVLPFVIYAEKQR